MMYTGIENVETDEECIGCEPFSDTSTAFRWSITSVALLIHPFLAEQPDDNLGS